MCLVYIILMYVCVFIRDEDLNHLKCLQDTSLVLVIRGNGTRRKIKKENWRHVYVFVCSSRCMDVSRIREKLKWFIRVQIQKRGFLS